MIPTPQHEFAPVEPRSRWRIPLAVLLTVVTLVPVVFAVLLFAFRPVVVYRIHGGVLEVRGGDGPLGSRRSILLSSVTATEEVKLGRGRRVAGTAMPGLCAGRFSYDRLGSVWQVTDCRRNVVLLRLAGEKRPVLVSPPDRGAFLDALSSGRDGDFSPPPVPEPSGWFLFRFGLILVLIPTALYVPWALMRAPGRLRYRVAGFELEVRLLLLRRRFPLAGSSARRYTPRKAWKMAGTAFSGYYAGSFRVDGTTTRVYATNLRSEGVLLEGNRRVFVTPADIPAFLDALRTQGVRVSE